MTKSRAVKFAITCAFVMGLAGNAMAATLTYKFTGITDSVDNLGSTMIGSVGSTVSGQFSFELGAATSVDLTNIPPTYQYLQGPWIANVSVDGTPFTIVESTIGEVGVFSPDSSYGDDRWQFITRENVGLNRRLIVGLSRPGLPFDLSFVPLVLANIADYEVATFIFGDGGPFTTRLRGHLTSFELVSEVPIPAALPLLAAGLSAMGFMGWRRKRKAAA